MSGDKRLKNADICMQKAVNDFAQGKITVKEFADICAILRQTENEPEDSAQEADKNSQRPPTEETFLIEDDNGFLVRVPANKLDSWAAADHDVPLMPEEERFKEKLLDSLYHKPDAGDKPPSAVPKASRNFNQPTSVLPSEQSRARKEPIDYVPIPWWRNSRILAYMALGLIAATLICAVIFSVVPGLPDPTAAVSPSPSVSVTPTTSASLSPPSNESLSVQERLDLMKQHENNNNKPLPKPSNGWVAYSTYYYGERVAPLTINAHSLTSDFFIKLRRPDTKAEVVSFYIHGNTQNTVYVPLGSFEILYASGSDWYGSNKLFGPETSYCLFDELFDFYEEDDYINGWTITLQKQSNGNLDSDQISADEFFGG